MQLKPGMVICDLRLQHFFIRDYLLGCIPVGRPYCMWCGREVGAENTTPEPDRVEATS